MTIQLYKQGQSFFEDKLLNDNQVKQLYDRLNINPDGEILVLMGKDGDVKRRTALQTDLVEIFEQIDAMPMRRYEMRK